ncbi:zinc ribbon domain-containing protein [Sulfolobus acidocaldarius]|uniref:Transposase n=4 Tax=Sulfolobus acidocaldarius TaxID=2285 RepID=A0A0U3H415_9CREN|nr:zinc ribbon domain-containing protein [Sulfolobus acidocaldarius]AAY79685.1 putative inactivated transposase [Sulfolobus acidocaldarius DSM 639]AGE70244.1 putative inactivated transposase [Sulfolobus acidocaldarius N8]AGE72519.1 putative inactivated transposase [Sulfolobus acidocaldarius Ron12/I]ALU29351.1 transposase [Sulfolobus acidocaldarius]ALU32080.1 transposase [Sulfolobus acidocaldarius]
MEELIEAKILNYGKLKEIHKQILFIREYSKIVKGGPPPSNIPRELYYQATSSSNKIRYGPLRIIGNTSPYRIPEVDALVSSTRRSPPLYAIAEFSDDVRVFLAYEKPKSIVGIDIGVRHLITVVSIREDSLWKVRYWGNDVITEEMIKVIGDPQGVSEIRTIKGKIGNIIRDVVSFIQDLNPKVVAIEDLEYFESKIGSALRTVEKELESHLYRKGVKFRKLPPYYTSKICSNCGFRRGEVMGPLFVCPSCGYKADRDFNAAYNLALQCKYTC